MKTHEVRSLFLEHFREKGHTIVPSSAIIPQNDPTTLFTGSGMQPMVPYLLGQTHPMGTRITDSQVCFRAEDIIDIGDNRHTTFFEMLGNWSLGDYFKKEQIPWMWEFLTEKLKLDPSRLYFSAFRGNMDIGIGEDSEAAGAWQTLFAQKGIEAKIGINPEVDGMQPGERIFYFGEKKNWWSRSGVPQNMPVGEPGGPDTEMFYDFDPKNKRALHENSEWAKSPCHVNCDCGRFIEIGNNVFMEYIRAEVGFEKLPQQNVDFGGGLERMVAATIDTPDIFMIDVFDIPRNTIEALSGTVYGQDEKNVHAYRVILDHLRAATFLLADGVYPAAKDQGYFTRRLIRRAVRYARDLGITTPFVSDVCASYIESYKDHYVHLLENKERILEEAVREEKKFYVTLESGTKQLEKIISQTEGFVLDGGKIFDLYETYGFPYELTEEYLVERGLSIDKNAFELAEKAHQELSRAGGEARFKGGLADTKERTIALHTAHHLLLAALQKHVSPEIHQRGSNITEERLRIDFSYGEKVLKEQLEKVESQVNEWIQKDLAVVRREMKKEDAEKIGAEHEFGAKYPDFVSVYFIEDSSGNAISKEFCGGPHVERTGTLGVFKILKEEASSAGVRRIKATLE
jgi:alanyl-tRNA synthetase